VQQLMSLNQGATSIETTMRELATLNQMFSGQVRILIWSHSLLLSAFIPFDERHMLPFPCALNT
jgi:hypothetical protein